MSAQLEHPHAPVAPPRLVPSHAASPDRDRGMSLLLSFVVAVSVMVADVVVIGAVGQSWVLIPGFAVLLLMATIIFRSIMRLLADGEVTGPDAH
jgi:hypothetical protein